MSFFFLTFDYVKKWMQENWNFIFINGYIIDCVCEMSNVFLRPIHQYVICHHILFSYHHSICSVEMTSKYGLYQAEEKHGILFRCEYKTVIHFKNYITLRRLESVDLIYSQVSYFFHPIVSINSSCYDRYLKGFW
jgi:hypothetical protein